MPWHRIDINEQDNKAWREGGASKTWADNSTLSDLPYFSLFTEKITVVLEIKIPETGYTIGQLFQLSQKKQTETKKCAIMTQKCHSVSKWCLITDFFYFLETSVPQPQSHVYNQMIMHWPHAFASETLAYAEFYEPHTYIDALHASWDEREFQNLGNSASFQVLYHKFDCSFWGRTN